MYRFLSPIVSWTEADPLDPADLGLVCEVPAKDVQAEVYPLRDEGDLPLFMMLFQPGLQTLTGWASRATSA